MTNTIGGFLVLLFAALVSSTFAASILLPISNSHRSVALELFAPLDGSFSRFLNRLALEALAGVVSLSSSEIDQSLIGTTKNDILKLLDSVEKYDDGSFYFDEKLVDAHEHHGPLSTTSSVVRGLAAFAAVAPGSLNIPSSKSVGLEKFFLSIDFPGDAKDLFYQVDSLAFLESNRVSIPLIVSPSATALSLTKKDPIKVKVVNTVLGSNAPPLTVNLARVVSSDGKGASIIENQELKYDSETAVFSLDLPQSIDVGNYIFVYEVVFHDPEHKKVYSVESQTQIFCLSPELSNLGTVEVTKKLDLTGESLLPLRLSFQLTTPLGRSLKPHQAVLKLRHGSKVEHVFLVLNSGKKFEIILDFLGLVEKFFYLSSKYDIQLTENSFFTAVGSLDLDLPKRPEKVPKPPSQPVEPYLRYGPKAEINYIFRAPEKRPPQQVL